MTTFIRPEGAAMLGQYSNQQRGLQLKKDQERKLQENGFNLGDWVGDRWNEAFGAQNNPYAIQQRELLDSTEASPYQSEIYALAPGGDNSRLNGGLIKRGEMEGKFNVGLDQYERYGNAQLELADRKEGIVNRLAREKNAESSRQFDATLAGEQEASRAKLGLAQTQLGNEHSFNMANLAGMNSRHAAGIGLEDRRLSSQDAHNAAVMQLMGKQADTAAAYNTDLLDLKRSALDKSNTGSGLNLLGMLFGG